MTPLRVPLMLGLKLEGAGLEVQGEGLVMPYPPGTFRSCSRR